MAVFRSRVFRWLASMALSVFLPLILELFRGAFLGLDRRVDFIFTLVVVGQSRVDLGQIELSKFFLDSLGRIATLEVKDDVLDCNTSSLDARLPTSNLWVLRDVRVDRGRRGGHDTSIIHCGLVVRFAEENKSWGTIVIAWVLATSGMK